MGSVLIANGPAAGPWPEADISGEAPDLGAPIRRALDSVRFTAPEPRSLRRREAALLGVLALALHAGVLYWLGRHATPPLPEVPVQVPPMTIEFSSPAPPTEPAASPPPPVAAAEPPPPRLRRSRSWPQKAPPKPAPKPKPQPPKQKAEPKPATTPPAKAEAPPSPTTAPPAAPAQAAPAAPAPAPAQAPLTPPSASAGYLRNPAPEYPALALRRNWQGTVLLRVHVLASGRPSEIQVQKSSGRDLLDEAAVAAVKRWSFVPAKRGDTAQDGWVSVPIDFKLN
ncbi:energy transducer TonB [Azotobacter sp. CWF10]